MNAHPVRNRLFKVSCLVLFLVSFFSAVPLHGQVISLGTSINESIVQAMDKLDVNWDRSSYNMTIQSSTYKRLRAANESAPSTFSVYSFKGNVEDPSSSKQADKRLKKMTLLLRKATDEMAAVSKQKGDKGQLKHLKPLLKFLGFSVSNMPVPVGRLDVSRSRLTNLTMAELALNGMVAEALTQAAEKMNLASCTAPKKHLAYKYLAASVLTIPAVWAYLEPEFSRLARKGGATTDNLLFAKLYMDRVPYFEADSRIWKNAPRFTLSQLKVSDPANKSGMKVELTDTETRVTVKQAVSSHETWFRFDENTVLVDNDTKERYKIKRIEDGIPLGKTFVLAGCSGATIDFTYVFPRVKQSMKSFYIDETVPAPSSEKRRIAYNKAHDRMSDGSITIAKTVYTLSDYVK